MGILREALEASMLSNTAITPCRKKVSYQYNI